MNASDYALIIEGVIAVCIALIIAAVIIYGIRRHTK